jgi:hypothetical protein
MKENTTELTGMAELLSVLFEAQVNSHIMHLQTNSLSVHLALNELYQSLPELIDSLCESFQGNQGIIRGYSNIQISSEDPQSFVQRIYDYVIQERDEFTDGYIQQLIDNIVEKLSGILYKLKNLK